MQVKRGKAGPLADTHTRACTPMQHRLCVEVVDSASQNEALKHVLCFVSGFFDGQCPQVVSKDAYFTNRFVLPHKEHFEKVLVT